MDDDGDDAADVVGERLDKVVAERFGLSRRLAREAIQRGRVDVGGEPSLDPARPVGPGEDLTHHPNRLRPETVERRLTILYEDDDVLIIDKPAGLLTQPTPDRESDTLLERAGRYLKRKRGARTPYVGIVHRLDQQATGAILVVTSPRALRPFQAIFRDHAADRTQLAVVEGIFLTPEGSIDLPLGGEPAAAEATERRGEATTHYQVLESYGRVASLVRLRPEPGRPSRVREHMAAIGHPVLGDPAPVPGRRGRGKPVISFPRPALHAASLGFVHPISKKTVHVESPLPADIAALIAELKQKHGAGTISPESTRGA